MRIDRPYQMTRCHRKSVQSRSLGLTVRDSCPTLEERSRETELPPTILPSVSGPPVNRLNTHIMNRDHDFEKAS
jgi:hypothetical protein